MKGRADDEWFDDEQPLLRGLVDELQRLKRRARARLPLVLGISLALTALVLYKKYKAPPLKEASVVLAVSEGSLATAHQPMPLDDLEFTVKDVLLSDTVLAQVLEDEHVPTPLGKQLAIAELREFFEISVYRNYFVDNFDIDSPRSARIAITTTATRGSDAWHWAHVIADKIVDGARTYRDREASVLAEAAQRALDDEHAHAESLEHQLAVAQAVTDPTAAQRSDLVTLQNEVMKENDRVDALVKQVQTDQSDAAAEQAGLGISFSVIDEQKPPDDKGPPWSFRIGLAAIIFAIVMPIVAIFIGAFDTRVHDGEDVERIGLPVLGQLPTFDGDQVGSLRARGVRRRRVPSS